MKKIKTLIVSHGDCDGICSAAIAKMKHPHAEVSFGQPFTISEDIRHAIERNGTPDLLLLLDIAGSEQLEAELTQLKDVEIVFIDHHPSSTQMKEIPNVNSFISTTQSASQLTAGVFEISETPLAKIGAIGDKLLRVSRTDPLLAEAQLISIAMSYKIHDDEFRAFLCRELAKGHMPSIISDVKTRAAKTKKQLAKIIDTAKANMIFESSKTIIIQYPYDNIDGYAGAVASKLAIEKKKVVLLMFRVANQPNMWIMTARAYRSVDVNLDEVMKSFNGGGHKYAAAGRIHEGQEEAVLKVFMGI
jgi:RecJ-like exonuclease